MSFHQNFCCHLVLKLFDHFLFIIFDIDCDKDNDLVMINVTEDEECKRVMQDDQEFLYTQQENLN